MRVALCGLLALLVAQAGGAAPGAPARGGEMQEIFTLSGLEAQLGSLDQRVAASLARSLQDVPAAKATLVKRAVLTEFSAPRLQQQVASRLEQVHQPVQAAGTLRWLRSPLGRRIAKLETDASSADSVRDLESFARQLESQPPAPARLALAREFDRVAGGTEFALELSLASARAAMSAMSGVLPEEARLQPDRIEAAIAGERERLRSQLEQASIVSALYAYRSLSDSELETYLAWTKSDAGRWYHGVVKQALLGALTELAGRMGRTVTTALRSLPSAPPARRAQ